jgi:acyl-CoA thioesterase FadM
MNLFFRLLWLNIRAQFRPKLRLLDTSVTSFRVWPTDLDPLMHMNNGKYLSLMDLGRLDLMLRSGTWKRLKQAGWYPVVAGQTIAYYKSLNPGKRFEIHSKILGLDDRWGFLQQEFIVDGAVHARAFVRTRFLKRSGGSVHHDEFESVFGAIPGDENVPDWVLEWAERARPTATKP